MRNSVCACGLCLYLCVGIVSMCVYVYMYGCVYVAHMQYKCIIQKHPLLENMKSHKQDAAVSPEFLFLHLQLVMKFNLCAI